MVRRCDERALRHGLPLPVEGRGSALVSIRDIWKSLSVIASVSVLALPAMTAPGIREIALQVPAAGKTGFTLLPPSVPWLAAAFPTHRAWSRATVADVLRNRQSAMKKLTISILATTVFLNRKDHFEARPLPAEAQFAPAFGPCVSDFDGDGREDIFLAQNFSAFRVEDTRLDAGRGLLLRGDGKGGFAAVSGDISGIKILGEQRGAAVADFDHDGRVDLAVGQNGAATKLFRNKTARPGLRVRLTGPASNPDGIGAVVRLKFAESWGPARAIHCGSGYWSQDSACVVLGTPTPPTAIQISWPGGQRTEQAVLQPTNEIVIKGP